MLLPRGEGGIKWLRHEVDYEPLSSTKVTSYQRYISTPSYVPSLHALHFCLYATSLIPHSFNS